MMDLPKTRALVGLITNNNNNLRAKYAFAEGTIEPEPYSR